MKKILFHICCGPCATASIKQLQQEGYEVVGFYYNPNIHPKDEYKRRLCEAKKLADSLEIDLIIPKYNYAEYFEAIGFKEGAPNKVVDKFPLQTERCPKCWELRIVRTAEVAKELGIDTIGTTLRISPYQDQAKLLEVGKKVSAKNNLKFYDKDLVACFHDSIKMSKEQGMYRQKYCGCIFSREYL